VVDGDEVDGWDSEAMKAVGALTVDVAGDQGAFASVAYLLVV